MDAAAALVTHNVDPLIKNRSRCNPVAMAQGSVTAAKFKVVKFLGKGSYGSV
jgi:hypothetical protein